MKRRTGVALICALLFGAAPLTALAGPASAATGRAVAPAALIKTTTTITAKETPGTSGPKVTFAIRVKAFSGAIPQGHVTLTTDCTKNAVDLILKATGRISYTHHCKVGIHKATAIYIGPSTTDANSPLVSLSFTVT